MKLRSGGRREGGREGPVGTTERVERGWLPVVEAVVFGG